MRSLSSPARVLFFVTTMGLATLGIVRFIQKRPGPGPSYGVYAVFNDAIGIVEHSQVRMSGIPVVTVEAIRLDHGKVRIDIRMDSGPLFADSAVFKKGSSLAGEYYLSISPGTTGRPQLQEGDQVPTVSA